MKRENTHTQKKGRSIRVKGTVQGVGFRPTVYKLANQLGIDGFVLNDADGVLINAWASPDVLNSFVRSISEECPPLAKIESIDETELLNDNNAVTLGSGFHIQKSAAGEAQTAVSADAATCTTCLDDSTNPFSRRYRYPFTNCTHCGPRLTIIKQIPYDRKTTSMAGFALCSDCQKEYEDPSDRRFHAQPNACYVCGPKAWIERTDGHRINTESYTQLDDVDAAAGLILKGEIIAIKGIGGFHLACDATNSGAVERLRKRKKRYAKPFALMAPTLETIRRYCAVSPTEEELLTSVAAPIVVLDVIDQANLANAIAPGQKRLGFMLPYTPLHHLIMRRVDRPIVLTSGNLSDEPQCTDNKDALVRLREVTDFVLLHDRDIVNRVDDSVCTVSGAGLKVMWRRARGYAPKPLSLPPGFEASPQTLAMGGELKNTFCYVKDGKACVSQHIGDLEEARTYRDYQDSLRLFKDLFCCDPTQIAIDKHPEYLSSKLGREIAHDKNLRLHEVQHHHAHIASCLAEKGRPLNAAPVLGIALDGLGYGDDGTLWGGEFLLCDYLSFERLGTFKPVAMPGGTRAILEPWRNTYAHLMAEIGWPRLEMDFEELELIDFLRKQNRKTLDSMIKSGTYAPLASSCGRLFDAVAAACGISRESVTYEGQAAIELESLTDRDELLLDDIELVYPFAIPQLGGKGIPYLEPIGMWQALLGDLILSTPAGVISARFHKGLAKGIGAMVRKLCRSEGEPRFNTVVLTGGVFQNKLLLNLVYSQLSSEGFQILTPEMFPPNDGGLSLGQAVIAAAREIKGVS